MRLILFFLPIVLFGGCGEINSSWIDVDLSDIDGQLVSFNGEESIGTVFFFLSPECPLCENYSLNINQLFHRYDSNQISMYGIFPGTYYSTSQIKAFKIKYEMDLPFLLDPNYTLTRSLKASVTPEVFVFNEQQELIYQGAIDNWMVSLGKKRTVITEHYLEDAIKALEDQSYPKTRKTKPIGCYIE